MSKRLLIVDESREVRENLMQMFSSMGISVRVAASGEDAVSQITAASPGGMPSLIVLSQELAEGDGKEGAQSLIKTIVKNENPDVRAIPLIVFSTFTAAGRLPALENASVSRYCRLGAIANLVQLVAGMLLPEQTALHA